MLCKSFCNITTLTNLTINGAYVKLSFLSTNREYVMKYIIVLLSLTLMTGCASTKNDYAINGQTEPLKIIGSMVILGVVAKSIAKPGTNSCVSTLKNQHGQTIGTSTIVKQGNC